MAVKTSEQLFAALNAGTKWDAGVAFHRTNGLPLDEKSIFLSLSALEAYVANDPVAYAGQVVAVVESGASTAYIINDNGTVTEIGSAIDIFNIDAQGRLRINTDVLLTSNNTSTNPTINKHISVATPTDDKHAANKEYVDTLVSQIPKFSVLVVDELPKSNPQTDIVYLLRNSDPESQNLYTEYIYIGESDYYISLDELGQDTPEYNNSPNVSTRDGTIISISYSSDVTPLINNVVWGYKEYFGVRDTSAPTFYTGKFYKYVGGWESSPMLSAPSDWSQYFFNYGVSNSSSGINAQPITVQIPAFATDTYYRKNGDGTYTLLTEAPYDWYTQIGQQYFTFDGSTYTAVLQAPTFGTYPPYYYRKKAGHEHDYELLEAEPANWSDTYNHYFTKDVLTIKVVGSAVSNYISQLNAQSDYIRFGMNDTVEYTLGRITIVYSGSGWESLGSQQIDISNKMDKFGTYTTTTESDGTRGVITPDANTLVIENLRINSTPTNPTDPAPKSYVDNSVNTILHITDSNTVAEIQNIINSYLALTQDKRDRTLVYYTYTHPTSNRTITIPLSRISVPGTESGSETQRYSWYFYDLNHSDDASASSGSLYAYVITAIYQAETEQSHAQVHTPSVEWITLVRSSITNSTTDYDDRVPSIGAVKNYVSSQSIEWQSL